VTKATRSKSTLHGDGFVLMVAIWIHPSDGSYRLVFPSRVSKYTTASCASLGMVNCCACFNVIMFGYRAPIATTLATFYPSPPDAAASLCAACRTFSRSDCDTNRRGSHQTVSVVMWSLAKTSRVQCGGGTTRPSNRTLDGLSFSSCSFWPPKSLGLKRPMLRNTQTMSSSLRPCGSHTTATCG